MAAPAGEAAIAAACAILERRRVERPAEGLPQDLPMMVGIDGAGGSGKTTLADGIRARLGADRVAIVHADDFYRPLRDGSRHAVGRRGADAVHGPQHDYERYFDWRRLRASALVGLRAGRPARFRRYDWSTDTLAEWVEVAPRDIVVVEGVYSTRPELRQLLDIAIFVDTPRDERIARMLARGQNAQEWIERWMAAEDWYLENIAPLRSADLVVAGS